VSHLWSFTRGGGAWVGLSFQYAQKMAYVYVRSVVWIEEKRLEVVLFCGVEMLWMEVGLRAPADSITYRTIASTWLSRYIHLCDEHMLTMCFYQNKVQLRGFLQVLFLLFGTPRTSSSPFQTLPFANSKLILCSCNRTSEVSKYS
jgi:hypothetical protein